MADREAILRTVTEAYAARQRGDKEGLHAHLAPGATYRLVGTSSLLDGMPVGPDEAKTAVGALIDRFRFLEVDHVATLVDGDQAAIHLRVRASADGGPEVTTELLDLWTFDDDARVLRIVQFADTALVAHILSASKIRD